MEIETRFVVNAMEKTHYNKFPINQLDGKKFLEHYMADLDSSHSFFYQPQVNEFYLRFADNVGLYLKQGNLYPAFEIFKTYKDNAQKRIAWVLNRLKEPFDFTQKTSFKRDRHDATWPVSQTEADDIWESRLKYDLTNEILSEFYSDSKKEASLNLTDPETFEKLLSKARIDISKRYEQHLQAINELEPVEIEEAYLTSFMQLSDPHSTFLSADTLEELSTQLHNSMIGLGIMLTSEDGYVVINEFTSGGPAEKSHALKPKDIILAVGEGEDGEFVDVVGMNLRKVIRLIRGKEGSYVRLLIRPAEDPSTKRVVTLCREEIKLTSNLTTAELFEVPEGNKTYKIGVIDIPSFYGPSAPNSGEPSVTKDVQELIKKLQAVGAEGLILDLRYNGGGLLPEAITLTGLFVPIGPILNVRDSNGSIREYLDTEPTIAWKGPLIVLVSRFSASASEIFAGALNDYHRVILVGDKSTHGKGTVQAVIEVDRPLLNSLFKRNLKLGAIKLTIQKWYLPDGNSTQLKGVESDIHIPSFYEYLPLAESDLKNPLPWDSIHSLPWNYSERLREYADYVDPSTLEELKKLSQARQQTLEEFKHLHSRIDFFRQKQEQKEFSLNLLERKFQVDKRKIIADQLDSELKKLAKSKFKSEKIYLDIAQKEPPHFISQKESIEQYLNESESEDGNNSGNGSKSENDSNKEENTGDEKKSSNYRNYDIHLREALRIMADYIDLEQHSANTLGENLLRHTA